MPGDGHGVEDETAPTGSASRPPRRRRWLRAAVVLVLLVVVGEAGARLVAGPWVARVRDRTFAVEHRDVGYITQQGLNFDPATRRPLLVYDPELFWRMQPGVRGSWFLTPDVRTNGLGMRGPPVPDRRPGERRVLVLGDSIAFGFGVAEDDRWADRLGALLAERGGAPPVVIDAGVVGYGSLQCALQLARLIDRVRPDVVLMACGVNDAILRGVDDDAFLAATTAPVARLHRALRSSALVCAGEGLFAWLRRSLHAWRTGEHRAVSLWIDWPDPRGEGPKCPRADGPAFRAHLDQAWALARQHGASLVLVDAFTSREVPTELPLDAAYFTRLAGLFDAMADWAAAHDVPMAHPRTALPASGRPPDELLRDFCHPTPTGHQLVAEEVLATLQRAGMLERAPQLPAFAPAGR